jgi:hypothetical protein
LWLGLEQQLLTGQVREKTHLLIPLSQLVVALVVMLRGNPGAVTAAAAGEVDLGIPLSFQPEMEHRIKVLTVEMVPETHQHTALVAVVELAHREKMGTPLREVMAVQV